MANILGFIEDKSMTEPIIARLNSVKRMLVTLQKRVTTPPLSSK